MDERVSDERIADYIMAFDGRADVSDIEVSASDLAWADWNKGVANAMRELQQRRAERCETCLTWSGCVGDGRDLGFDGFCDSWQPKEGKDGQSE